MKLSHPQETLRLVKALKSEWPSIAIPISLLFRKIDDAFNNLNHDSVVDYERWLILSGVFTTAFKRLIMSYIKENHLEVHIVNNFRHSLYSNNLPFDKRFDKHLFESQLQHFRLENKIQEQDLTIDLIIDQFCYIFAPNEVRERLAGVTFFPDLFSWADSYEGYNFWANHSSKFKYNVCHLSFTKILALQFIPTK